MFLPKMRVVPPPSDRYLLAARVHHELGHFGPKQTLSLLLNNYYWTGMLDTVKKMVATYQECDRVKTSFRPRRHSYVHPLPIRGMF